MKAKGFIESISPAELAKKTGKSQVNSTRDKKLLLKKVDDIVVVLSKFNKTLNVEENEANGK